MEFKSFILDKKMGSCFCSSATRHLVKTTTGIFLMTVFFNFSLRYILGYFGDELNWASVGKELAQKVKYLFLIFWKRNKSGF